MEEIVLSPFVATTEVEGATAVIRYACVRDLSIEGAYIGMPDPFSRGVAIRIKIRTKTGFFQADAIVAHSTFGAGIHTRNSIHTVCKRTVFAASVWT
jgi:hypothetical protein